MALKSKFIIGDLSCAQRPACAALNTMPARHQKFMFLYGLCHMSSARLAALHGRDQASVGEKGVKTNPSCFWCQINSTIAETYGAKLDLLSQRYFMFED